MHTGNDEFPHNFLVNAGAKKRGALTAIRDTVAFELHKEIADPQGHYLILMQHQLYLLHSG